MTLTLSFPGTGPYPDLCARRFAFPRYPYALAAGYNHSVVPAGSLSTRMRMTFGTSDSSQETLVALFLTKPNAVTVAVNGVTVPASTTVPSMHSPTGMYRQPRPAHKLIRTQSCMRDGVLVSAATRQLVVAKSCAGWIFRCGTQAPTP